MKKILFIVGSLREGSFNRQLAHEAEQMIGARAEVTYLDYKDVPLINQDIEFPEPAAVGRLRAAVKEADGIWVFTPEYNFSYPGHVKNLFDWLSRPLVAGDYETPTVINGKKVALMVKGQSKLNFNSAIAATFSWLCAPVNIKRSIRARFVRGKLRKSTS